MKIIQLIRKKFALMGFVSKQQENNSQIFSIHQRIEIYACALCTSLTVIHFFHVANGMEEYLYSLFTMTAAITISVSHASMAYKNDKIFTKIIDVGETMWDES